MNTNFMQRIDTAIDGLQDLAYNLWWTWNPRAQDLFRLLSERKWRSSNHNAVAVMHSLSRQELRARLSEKEFLVRIEEVLQEFDAYLTKKDTWYADHAGGPDGSLVAYFSAEFGLHEEGLAHGLCFVEELPGRGQQLLGVEAGDLLLCILETAHQVGHA